MPYCVHCGVKLNPAEKRCPLCDTVSYDPHGNDQSSNDHWPNHMDVFPQKKIHWQFVSKMAVWIIAAIACIVTLCDLLTTGGISWSCFVNAGCLFAAGLAAIPIFRHFFVKAVVPFIGTAGSLFLIAEGTHGMRWFLYLALPATVISTGYIAVSIWLARSKKPRLFYRITVCLLLLILSLVIIECVTDLYSENSIHIFWSLYAVIPLFFITLFFTIAAHNRRIVEYIRKNMFLSPH